MITRPMLSAAAVDRSELEAHMPETVWASPKLDGIRCLLHPDMGAVSRNFKSIPNQYIRNCLAGISYLDGELVTYTNGNMDDFNTVQSKVMSRDGLPDFKLLVFDCFRKPDDPFHTRLMSAFQIVTEIASSKLEVVDHTILQGVDDFINYADTQLVMGYEGAMYRLPGGPYKNGRSTLRQGWLVKWKDIQDAEGTVMDFIERQHNDNELTHDAFGLAERSSHKEHMVGMNTLGALLLDTQFGIMRVGTGFDDAMRQHIWDNKEKYRGATVTFKYQPHGMQNLPRFPVFKSFRLEE